MSSFLEKIGLKKAVDPVEQAKEWSKQIKKELRAADREIRELSRSEDMFIKEVKKVALLGTRGGTALKTLATNVVLARKAKERACNMRAQLNSVGMTLTHQIATIKMSKCMAQSADVMKAVNDCIKLPELSKSMAEMAREMEKAGLIEEIVGEAIEDAVGGEVEEEADREVEKVLAELTMGLFEKTGDVVNQKLPSRKKVVEEEEVEEAEPEETEDLNDMKARLQAL